MAKIKEVVKTVWEGGVEGFQTNLTIREEFNLLAHIS